MRGSRQIVVAVAVALMICGTAHAATVVCNGLESGGQGPTAYYYEVTLGPNEWMIDFQAGTDCLVPPHYGNWISPPGWGPVLFGLQERDTDVKTPHGGLSPGPTGLCPASVLWTPLAGAGQINGPGTFFFGYDNDHPSHDVGWTVTGLAVPNSENWNAAVGMGAGPVHGPVPEPGTLVLLAAGGLCLLCTWIRRRR